MKMKQTSTYSAGHFGEAVACDYLIGEGYCIKERNFRTPLGEIDIIAQNERHILFVEVKSRSDTAVQKQYGRPSAAVNEKKRQRIIGAARLYLQQTCPAKGTGIRLDVIEILYSPLILENGDFTECKITHIKNAFTAQKKYIAYS